MPTNEKKSDECLVPAEICSGKLGNKVTLSLRVNRFSRFSSFLSLLMCAIHVLLFAKVELSLVPAEPKPDEPAQ